MNFLNRWKTWKVAFALCALWLLLPGGLRPAHAQIQRDFGARYADDLRGDIVLTGNTVIRPTSATATGNGNTAAAFTDVDGVTLSPNNSSSAQLKLPAGVTGANIEFARLYWVGRVATSVSTATAQSIRFSTSGGGAYQAYTANANTPQLVYFTPSVNITSRAYSAYVDVTAQMKGAGATPTLLAGGLGADPSFVDGLGPFAGWSVVVAYRKSGDTLRQLRVFDGLGVVRANANDGIISTPLSGFRTPDSGNFVLRLGSVVFEGDSDVTGDVLRFNGIPLSDAVNPADNFFNSTVSQDGVLFDTELNPRPRNNSVFGMDVDRTSFTGASALIGAAQESATLEFITTGDSYYTAAFTTSIPTFEIKGRVFEDSNFGGGDGRAFNDAPGATGAVGARVELYNAVTGAYVTSATTVADGFYYFYNVGAGRFNVRVVNSTVKSNRAGGTTAGLLPVQTYRTDASGAVNTLGSATPTPVTNKVGGEFPGAADPGASTSAFPAGSQSVSTVILGDEAVANVDFGFNFDTIVNTNDAGQGSLRQFVLNSNALGNGGLAQQGLTPGVETSIFQIPTTDARFQNGVAKITLASPIVITGANAISTAIDGRTQTSKIGDTNAGLMGSGGVVGVGNVPLARIPRPEIEINGANSVLIGLDVQAASAILRNISVWGFGTIGNNNNQASVRVGNTTNFAGPLLTELVLGAGAVSDGSGQPVNPTLYGKGDLLRARNVNNGTISNSLVAFGGNGGINIFTGSAGWLVQGNEVRDNSRDINFYENVAVSGSGAQILENLIYNSGGTGIDLYNSPGNNTIRNNTVRSSGLGSTPTSGETPGVMAYGTGNTVSLNILRDNYGAGLMVTPTPANGQTLISQNSIFGNGEIASKVSTTPTGQIGIDLLGASDSVGTGTSPYVTPNSSGAKVGGNGLLNFPILTKATIVGGQLTLEGFAPAGANVEAFIAAPDPTGFGEGRTYLFAFKEGQNGVDSDATTGDYNAATLTAAGYPAAVAALAGSETGANRFRVTGAAGTATTASTLTLTATVADRTSEFSPVLRAGAPTIGGRVYEDPNFGGGAGRAFSAAQNMAGVANARVEIYNAAGAFVGAANSAADGLWNYEVPASGIYYARVVSNSVASNRAGSTSALLGVQTFRTNDGAAVTNEVGGRAPQNADAGAGATGTTLNVTTFQLSGGTTGQAQNVSQIVVANSAARTNLDFGFNFDTIVNTNDAGQGSLRQFVLNSNALGNDGLAQQGLTAGVETSLFQIPTTDTRFAGGAAKITLASGLVITGANAGSTAIDGTTQTAKIGDTNEGVFGSSGTVGVDKVPLPTVPRPEIEINGARAIAVGLDIDAPSVLVRGVSMWGFGNSGDSPSNATIRVGSGASSNFAGATITQVLLGASATTSAGNAPVTPATYGRGDLVGGNGVKSSSVTNSVLAFGGGKGINLKSGADNWTVQGNEVRNNARDNANWDGIDAQVAGTQILENLFYNQGGNGIDTFNSAGSSVIRNNTVRNNALLGTPTSGETPGIRVFGNNNSITLNVINSNYGAGVLVQPSAKTLISRNSIFGNGEAASNSSNTISGQIGIDLLGSGNNVSRGTSPYVTPNASGTKTGANGLLNFPVITAQTVTGGNLTLEGFAPAGATVEIFTAAPDPSGFGEGQTFAFSFVEGSGADTDTTTGNYDSSTLLAVGYPSSVANLAGSETGARRFRVTVAASGLSANTPLTATATVANQTSEFSPVTVTFVAPAANTVNGTVYLDANRNGTLDNQEGGAGLSGLFVKAVLAGQNVATQAVPVDAATGAFQFSGLAAGNYTLVLDDNATLSDTAPAIPSGYVGTQSPNGTRQLTVGNQTILGQDFGLFSGAQLSGIVYEDNGLGGGSAGDGIRNGGELGLAGVKLNLTTSAGTVIDTATTDGSGNFSFRVPNNVASGSLRIVETNLADYVSTGATVGTTGGNYDRPSDAITFAYTAGATYSGLSFGDVRGASLTGEDSKTATIGSSVSYAHVFRAQTAGSVVFSTDQLPAPANPNWSVVAFRDSNGNGELDGGDLQIGTAPIAVVAGDEITIFLQNFVPVNAANGAQDRLTLTATFTASGANAPPVQVLTRQDLTTVAANQGLVLVKAVDKAKARSGDVLLYTITYRNTGADALTSLVVSDATPAYTTFVSAADGTRPPGLTGVTIAAPPAGGAGPVSWTFAGSLNPGQSGTVTFQVKVQ